MISSLICCHQMWERLISATWHPYSQMRVDASDSVHAGDNNVLILTKQWLSSVYWSSNSLSVSSTSIKFWCRLSHTLARSLFRSFVLSSYCLSRHVRGGMERSWQLKWLKWVSELVGGILMGGFIQRRRRSSDGLLNPYWQSCQEIIVRI